MRPILQGEGLTAAQVLVQIECALNRRMCAAGQRLDLGGLGKKQRAALTPQVSGHLAFGLLRHGESVMWASRPVDEPITQQQVRLGWHASTDLHVPCSPAHVVPGGCRQSPMELP